MADTKEMRRLMVHAADLLAANDPTKHYKTLVDKLTCSADVMVATAHLGALRAAMGTAEALLRMVSAAMGDEPRGEGREGEA